MLSKERTTVSVFVHVCVRAVVCFVALASGQDDTAMVAADGV